MTRPDSGDDLSFSVHLDRDGWRYTLWYDITGDRSRPIKLEIGIKPGPSGPEAITFEAVRAAPLRELYREADRYMTEIIRKSLRKGQ